MTTLDERHGEHGEGAHGGAPPRSGGTLGSHVVALNQPTAALPLLTGSKAAHLARAAGAGLPVLPGFVIAPGARASDSSYEGAGAEETPDLSEVAALPSAWAELSRHGTRPLVVRSSSAQEDTEESSLAGQFDSVLDVRGWEEFRAAVRTVLGSARRPDGDSAPMAVLVQPMLRARVGGVLFGADPVAGRTDRMLVSAVPGGPDTLVSGERPGTSYWLSRWGRLLRTESAEEGEATEATGVGTAEAKRAREGRSPAEPNDSARTARPVQPRATVGPRESVRSAEASGALRPAVPEPLLTAAELRRLARLARRAARVFGGPQDIEFGFDEDGRLWLFQSRPITAMAARPPRGARLLGSFMSVSLAPPHVRPDPLPTAPPRPRSLRRNVVRVLIGVLLGYLALWTTGSLGILAVSYVARETISAPEGTRSLRGVHNFQPVGTDGELWRGAAPSPAGYRALADLGFTTVVDLRAENLSAAQVALPREAGLDVVRVPMRDGQTPTPEQVQRLLDTVSESSGPVFVHCGAGVGRTGTMAAAYLVRTGQEDSPGAVWRNLSVGPPSIEQIYYGLMLERERDTAQPPVAVVVMSRIVDAPRRIWSYV